jgi:4-hydroxy-tetrahydrodipicolinate synthase
LSSYNKLAEVFLYDDIKDFISLNQSIIAYSKLSKALDEQIKMALFTGKPGVGKTYLLKRLFSDFEDKYTIVMLLTPHTSESEFMKVLYYETFGEKVDDSIGNFYKVLELYKNRMRDENIDQVAVILDEFQLYSDELREKIRLMSDSGLFKFILTIHKVNKSDVISQSYFQSRIWEVIKLDNVEFNDIKIYIERKILLSEYKEFAMVFNQSNYRKIYYFTKGNLRLINKLLHKVFSLCAFYDSYQPDSIRVGEIKNKIIEMAAIDLRMTYA